MLFFPDDLDLLEVRDVQLVSPVGYLRLGSVSLLRFSIGLHAHHWTDRLSAIS